MGFIHPWEMKTSPKHFPGACSPACLHSLLNGATFPRTAGVSARKPPLFGLLVPRVALIFQLSIDFGISMAYRGNKHSPLG